MLAGVHSFKGHCTAAARLKRIKEIVEIIELYLQNERLNVCVIEVGKSM
jgi:hypothetical protein